MKAQKGLDLEMAIKVAKRHGVDGGIVRLLWPPQQESASVDDIVTEASEAGIAADRRALVHFLKDLERLQYGQFELLGCPSHTNLEKPVSSPPDVHTTGTISHRFVLRPDFRVDVDLPADMTQAEARRLAAFITSLPFEDGEAM
jgi:hypothetical protein